MWGKTCTVEPPSADTSTGRTPPNMGQFSSVPIEMKSNGVHGTMFTPKFSDQDTSVIGTEVFGPLGVGTRKVPLYFKVRTDTDKSVMTHVQLHAVHQNFRTPEL